MRFLHLVFFVFTMLLLQVHFTTQKPNAKTRRTRELIEKGHFKKTPVNKNWTVKENNGSCQCGIRKPSFGIINGERTRAGEYPWMVALQEDTGVNHICGGVIINPRWVLTANHCPVEEGMKVIGGSNNLRRTRNQQIKTIERVIGFSNSVYDYETDDIKLVLVDSEFEFNDYVTPICLPFNLEDQTFANEIVEASGWGRLFRRTYTSSPILYKIQKTALSNDDCRERGGQLAGITEAHICAEGENVSGMCHGDSGSPLVYEVEPNHFTVLGLASFVESLSCYKATVYTRVSSFLDWISDNTGIDDFCKPF